MALLLSIRNGVSGETIRSVGTPTAVPDPDVVAWLLDCDDPSVRYFTLTRLLGEPMDGAAATEARRRIMAEGAVPLILAAQREDGHWCERERFYTPSTPARSGSSSSWPNSARMAATSICAARDAIPARSRAGQRNRFGVWNIDS